MDINISLTAKDILEGQWGEDLTACLSKAELKAEGVAERKDAQRREGGTPMTAEEIEASEKAHTKMCEEMRELRDRGRG